MTRVVPVTSPSRSVCVANDLRPPATSREPDDNVDDNKTVERIIADSSSGPAVATTDPRCSGDSTLAESQRCDKRLWVYFLHPQVWVVKHSSDVMKSEDTKGSGWGSPSASITLPWRRRSKAFLTRHICVKDVTVYGKVDVWLSPKTFNHIFDVSPSILF